MAKALLPLGLGEVVEPLTQGPVSRLDDGFGLEGIRQVLEALGIGTIEKGVILLTKSDPLLAQAPRQPFVAVAVNLGVEGKVGTQADKHPAALRIAQVNVVEVDMTPGHVEPVAAAGIA